MATETPHHLPAHAVDMFEDDDFLASSQSSEVRALGAPDDAEVREKHPTSGITTIRNASRSY
jgi:hypothetical protein